MDISPKTRVLKNLVTECLALLRIAGRLPPDEADVRLLEVPARLRDWSARLEAANDDIRVRELPGLDGYTLWAETYDDEPDNCVIQSEEQHIWNALGPVAGKTVLDVGAGTGRHAVRLAELGASVVASEPNATLREVAIGKDRLARVRWLALPIEDLPSNLGTFDLVLCCLVLSHVEDLCLAVRTLSRFVAVGGRLILTDFHPFNLMIGWRTGFNHDGKRYALPNYLHLPSEYFRAIQATGLTIEDFLEVGGFPNMPDQPATIIITGRRNRSTEMPIRGL